MFTKIFTPQILPSQLTSPAVNHTIHNSNEKSMKFLSVFSSLWVQNNSLRKEGTFDCLTVGAFTAIPHGFKGGGLLKLLRNFHATAMQIDCVLPAREAVQSACQTLRHIHGAVKLLLGAGGVQNDFSAVLKIVESLIKRVRSLTTLLDTPFVGKEVFPFLQMLWCITKMDYLHR